MFMNEKKLDITCCKAFEEIIPELGWFKTIQENKDDKIIFMMPYIENKGVKYRVNFCPSCGTNIRSIIIDEFDFIFLT